LPMPDILADATSLGERQAEERLYDR